MPILKAGIFYFALVFGAGCILGPMRVLWAVPRFGTRIAELLEMPIMFGVIMIVARWITQHFAEILASPAWLGVGGIALGLLLIAECTLVLWMQGRTIVEYIASRDPVAGTVYLVMLVVFAMMPLWVARR